MHGSEENNTDHDIMRDSSQTLPNGHFHPGIGEDELPEYQLPKQVHASDLIAKTTLSSKNEDLRSYKSQTDNVMLVQPSKNMKDSMDSKFDYRLESRTLASNFIQSKEPKNGSLVKSPSELANKYEQKLVGSSNINQFSEKNTKISSQLNPTDQHMHLINDLSLENKISRIDMVPDSAASNNMRRSLGDSYFCETDINRDLEKSRSRSNHRQGELLSNQIYGLKPGSPKRNNDLIMDDDEITERIRLQGERLIQQPEIVHNQPHKVLERAMKGQKENDNARLSRQNTDFRTNGQSRSNQALNSIENHDLQTLSNKEDTLSRAKNFKEFSREQSLGREEKDKSEIFDGSFGRKKRDDSSQEFQRHKFKIESKPLFRDNLHQSSFDAANQKSKFGADTFERKFGINGPSGRANKTSRLTQRDFVGIGSGISQITYERSSNFNNASNFRDSYKPRESKSIPRQSIAFDHLEPPKVDEKGDSNFSELVKKSDIRRTMSTSPYGGLRSNVTSSYRNIDKSSEFKNNFANEKYKDQGKTESSFQNRFRSPLDDLYKQHQNKGQSQGQNNDDLVDDQFKQCQDLLQRAKDRRLKMGMPSQNQDPVPKTDVYQSRLSKKTYDHVDVPDVKSLQSRYEYLMDTIKEKESEGTKTEHSLTKSDNDDRRRGGALAHAKTMKWKKGSEKSSIVHPDSNHVSDYKSRPLRVPKPPQSANQKSNITQTYEWLMKKHESSVSHTNDSNVKQPGLTDHRYHAISFGHIQDGSSESLNNPGFLGSRHHSLGKPPNIDGEKPVIGSSSVNKYRPDLSQYSRNQSNHSNERSFYKPMSPDVDLNSRTNQARMQYDPKNQVGATENRQYPRENSLEREKISVPSSFDYQQRVFGTQPQAQKKFQIERRAYDNIQTSSNLGIDQTYQSKQFEFGQTSNTLAATQSVYASSNISTGIPIQPLSIQQNPYPSTQAQAVPQSLTQATTSPQISSTLPQVCGQIGKIVRQGQKQDNPKPPITSLHSTYVFNGELNDSMLNTSNELIGLQDQEKKVAGKIQPANLILEQQNSAPYTQPVLPTLHGQDTVSQTIRTGQTIMTPGSNNQNNIFNSQNNVFQRIDKAQALFRSAMPNQGEGNDAQANYKTIFFSKYAPSFQLKQFNGEFINEMVNLIENITNLYVDGQKHINIKDNKFNPLSSLDFSHEDKNPYTEIGQHLKEKYDTSKDPNTWVPQLYADMCKARTIATKNEEDYKKEKDKNDELMKQIETLERDLLAFRKDLVQMENCQSTSREVEKRIKDQTQVELEWIERIDALISSQKFYSNGEAPKQLPESTYDVDAVNTKKVFSQLLNKLEVLLCHQELEKSKAKKFMENTVQQMDSRITYISDKFIKIQKKIIETCSIDDTEYDEAQQSNKASSHRSSLESVLSHDCPTMKGTIEMLKKIRRDRDEQEKIIEQLKQIIQIQDKFYKADTHKIDSNLKEHVMKNIENFVNEEHKKPAKNMQLGWVAEVSEISMSYDIIDSGQNYKQSQKLMTHERSSNLNEYCDEFTTNNFDEMQMYSMKGAQQRDLSNISYKKLVEYTTSEVQTEMDMKDKYQPATKVYKEITIQTDPVNIKTMSTITLDDEKCDMSPSKKSSTTTDRREKQLNKFQEGLQQNMNDLLTEQLSKHLQQNLTEIATIKQENGRLIEKYKFEQKQVSKLKEDLRRKQKYEQFFEKQRAKKYRNCGCQIGPSQLKYAFENENSSSYHQKSQSTMSLAMKSQHNLASRRFNKENKCKFSDKNEGSNHIMLKNVLKSPILSANLRSPEDQTNKSGTDFTSLNTQVMQTKYGVQDYSIDDKAIGIGEFNQTRGNSQLYNCSQDFSKSASVIDESQIGLDREPHSSQTITDANIQEKKMLQYHIKKNQELHELLRAYLTKIDDGKSSSNHDTQALLSLLNPQPSTPTQLFDHCDTLNQRQPQLVSQKEHEEHTATSNLASSANFGNREQGKDSKSIANSNEKKKQVANSAVLPTQTPFSEQTEITKKCDFIDQYVNYKNSQKRDMAFAMPGNPTRQILDDAGYKAGHQQSFGDTNDLQAALILNQNRSSSGNRPNGFGIKNNNGKMLENSSLVEDYSKTERLSVQKEENEKGTKHQEDDASDNINVSEQIKSIEGRQMLLCEVLDSQQQHNVVKDK